MEEDSASDKDLHSDSPTISWPRHRPASSPLAASSNGYAGQSSESSSPYSLLASAVHANNLPTQPKSLSAISLRASLLGVTFGISISTTLSILSFPLLNVHGIHRSSESVQMMWRAPFFLSALSLFHFLEYYTTALYNTRRANVSAFLLSRNGRAYNAAHCTAFTETILMSCFLPDWQSRVSNTHSICIGLAMVALGQSVRTVAMAQAGTNFNHTVQTRRVEGHTLMKSGVYKYLRHPSYFGFFWWGLGTQLVLGNALCLVAYTAILWLFFSGRIQSRSMQAFVTLIES